MTRELDDDEKLDEFCTVLCVDVSHSMAGEPFEEQRTEAKKIIEGKTSLFHEKIENLHLNITY